MPTKNDNAEIALIENVLLSTENALKALTSFEQSLVKSRFKEGVGSYANMCKALIGQRIWSMDKNNMEIDNNFQKISQTAQNIINIIKPYIQNFEKLAVLEERGTSNEGELFGIETTSAGRVDDDDKRLLEIVRKHHANQISYTSLRALLGWERKRLDGVLASVAKKHDSISINTSGSRKMIHLNK
jgi:hypothetical protein